MKEMDSGGTEVSFLNLINIIKDKYDITLFLMKNRGIFSNDIPKNVKIIEMFDNNNIKIIDSINKNTTINAFIRKIIGKIYIKKSLLDYYNYIAKYAIKSNESFDYCIDYHGYGFFGSYYAIKYVNARKKITFVHDEKIDWINSVRLIYKDFDQYFCVSNSCAKILNKKYLFTCKKTFVCRNVIDSKKVLHLSNEKIVEKLDGNTNILTIGRLEYQKGYDLLLKVALLLKAKKIKFKWYIIGGGSLYNYLNNEIIRDNLSKNLFLLNVKKNPYPYLKKCDIYAQTSRHEGYGIAIAEARILNKPIISTNIDCIKEQIEDNVNGILSSFNEKEYSAKLIKLICDISLQKRLIRNLKKQNINDTVDFEMLVK